MVNGNKNKRKLNKNPKYTILNYAAHDPCRSEIMQLRSQSVVNLGTPVLELPGAGSIPSPAASPARDDGFEAAKVDFNALFRSNPE